MSLPPALLQRLAQRGLVQKQQTNVNTPAVENEEVIAEDYDEMDNEPQHDTEEEYQYPPLYDNEITVRKPDDSFWLERMRARMGEGNSYAGYKGCPNKYNIYHKCTLFCVNRWENGHKEPSHEYMRRYKRMLRKYPLPKGWTEHYDPGCGVYYFANETDAVVSWLSPTHPKSVITKSAAMIRKKIDENNGENIGSDGEDDSDESSDSNERSAYKSVSRRSRSPIEKLYAQDFPSLHETLNSPPRSLRKQKSREKERGNSRRHERESEQEHERDRNRERNRDREWDRERLRGRDRYAGNHRARGRDADTDALDPMDPSAYSDIPRGNWSDGLQQGSEKSKKNVEERKKRDSSTDEESEKSA